MTLDDVARACDPPTTPQTIGRLETGTRTVSVGWLNRIAAALGVEASDLVDHGDRADLGVVAILGGNGASAPKRTALVVPPRANAGQVAVTVSASLGDYRAGDEIWCDVLQPEALAHAAQFSWSATADGLLATYRDALADRSGLLVVNAR